MKVSIILTVYNREQYLSAAIESFLAQTYSQAELIVWDDGSTDSSLSIARNYAHQDLRVKVIPARHQGRVNALYDAMEIATGDYLGWLDSDDLLRPTALEETIAVLDRYPNVGMVYTDYWVIDEQSTIKGLGNRCLIPYSKEQLLVDFMTFHFQLFRRVTYLKAGKLDRSMKYAQDYDLCLKISEITEIKHISSALYCYRSHESSVSIEHKLKQTEFSRRAVLNALKRRQMDKEYSLEVLPGSKFVLRKVGAAREKREYQEGT
ncbi:MAG: glycosyltransferase [Cyanobacteria bacterium J06649_4]